MATLLEERLTELISNILDKKEELQRTEEDIDSLKNELIQVMTDNKLTRYSSLEGKAQIMSFTREGLIKEVVLSTFQEVNEGKLEGRINVSDHIKLSPVYFVLVKEAN